jgi:hypothetical protein
VLKYVAAEKSMNQLGKPTPGRLSVTLLLAETNMPEQMLFRGAGERRLHLPAFADLSIMGDALEFRIRLRDEGYDWWSTRDSDGPNLIVPLSRAELILLELDHTWPPEEEHGHPAVSIHIRDPHNIDPFFFLTLASTDANNPMYWIKAFQRLWVDLDLPVRSRPPAATDPPGSDGEDDIPF